MLYLNNDDLVFAPPEVHAKAQLTVSLNAIFTLKVAGKAYSHRNVNAPLARGEVHEKYLAWMSKIWSRGSNQTKKNLEE